MDLATIIGLLAAFGFIVWSMMSGAAGGLAQYIDIPSMVLVLGGTVAATLTQHSLSQFMGIFGVIKKAFFAKEHDPYELIDQLTALGERARREGLLTLEREISEMDDEFMSKGIKLIVDGIDPEQVEEMLHSKLLFLKRRHETGQGILKTLATYAPAFGMMGTVIGLIQMLASLDNHEALYSGMALALITTLYGSILPNVVFLPLAGKLKVKSDNEIFSKQLIIHGLMTIQAGEHPRIIREKLLNFLPPNKKETIEDRNG